METTSYDRRDVSEKARRFGFEVPLDGQGSK